MNTIYEKFIKDKSVILVCPSPVLKGKNLGKWIDSFDVVIRTNGFFNITENVENDYGKKCDVLYVNGQFSREMSPFPVRQWYEKGLRWICFKCGVSHKQLYSSYVNTRTISHLHTQIKDELFGALMGSVIVQDIINLKPKKFFVSGMTFYQDKILDWENQYLNGYLPEKVYKEALQKRAKGYFTKDKIHDTYANRVFILKRYQKGLINFDDHTKKAIGLEKNADPNKIIINSEDKIMKKYDNPLANLMPRTISIRNAANAKIGLQDMCNRSKEILGNRSIKILEIGSYAGDSTELFARNFDTVYSVDPYLNGYDKNDSASNSNMNAVEEQFLKVMKNYNNIKKFKMKSLDASILFDDEEFDIVYIDGNHQEKAVIEDIKAWLPKVKKGGVLAGHDYQAKKFPGTVKAVKDLLGEVQVFSDTSWLWIKK